MGGQMTPEQITALHTELMTDPANLGYTPFRLAQPGHIVERLNAPTRTVARPRMVTTKALLAELTLTEFRSLMNVLKVVAASDVAVEEALVALRSEGLEVTHANTLEMLDQLVTASAITQALANKIEDMAKQPGSRAEELFGAGARVTELDVLAALEN